MDVTETLGLHKPGPNDWADPAPYNENMDALDREAAARRQAQATHEARNDNPHGVTAEQCGADPSGTAASAVSEHNLADDAHEALFRGKQSILSGAPWQVVGFSEDTQAMARDILWPELCISAEDSADITVVGPDGKVTHGVAHDGVAHIKIARYGDYQVTAEVGADVSDPITVRVDAVRVYYVRPTIKRIYGAEWAGGPSSKWRRTDAAAGLPDPVPAVGGGSGSSPFDRRMPWAGIQRVYHAQVGHLVAIPRYWYRWTAQGIKIKLQISSSPRPGYQCAPAHADRGDGAGERPVVYVGRYPCDASYRSRPGRPTNGTYGWDTDGIHKLHPDAWMTDLRLRWTIAMLYLVEYATWDSEASIGRGSTAGTTDGMLYHTGTMAASRTTPGRIQYRHLDGLWDCGLGEWINGLHPSAGGLVVTDPVAPDATDVTLGLLPTGYPRTVDIGTKPGYAWLPLPASVGGTESSYVPDYIDVGTDSGDACCTGGSEAGKDGLFALSARNRVDGISPRCRLMVLPDYPGI